MTDKNANQMWGGRFAAGPDAIMEAINASIGFDQRMAAQDIAGSRAHAAMLAATGIVSDKDAEAMREGLLTILSEIEEGRFEFSAALEDIHMNIEARLAEQGGSPEEWARLITSLTVLGNADRARAIWDEAQQRFASAPQALATVGAAAQSSGLTE